jgi:LacI family transcriptional regulator
VLVDDIEVGRQAARHLIEKGFLKFGYCTHLPGKGFSIDRMEGFRSELEKAGAKMDLLAMEFSDPPACPDLRQWVDAAGEERAAVFCCDDACAGLLIACCLRSGLQVPGDLAILGAGNDDFHVENDSVTLSSVIIDFAGVGYHAAALLSSLMAGKPAPEAALRIPPQGVAERSSTASGPEPPALRRLFRLLNERHADPDFNPTVAADLCHVSARTLRRYLKETGRPSLVDLLRDRRLGTAKQRLLVTDEPVERVAEHSGFIDYTTFFRAFRKRYGMNPTDQRREGARQRAGIE